MGQNVQRFFRELFTFKTATEAFITTLTLYSIQNTTPPLQAIGTIIILFFALGLTERAYQALSNPPTQQIQPTLGINGTLWIYTLNTLPTNQQTQALLKDNGPKLAFYTTLTLTTIGNIILHANNSLIANLALSTIMLAALAVIIHYTLNTHKKQP